MMKAKDTLLVTGGAGYIGSHFLEYWAQNAFTHFKHTQWVILDDLSSGHPEILEKIGQKFSSKNLPNPIFEKIDLREIEKVRTVFSKHQPNAVIHFAGKISVAESVSNPGLYQAVNVQGSKNLLQVMQESGCKKLIFSSTAAVYQNLNESGPIFENFPLDPVSPYGETKLQFEKLIEEASREWGLESIIFRYFNAAGAALSTEIGEWHEPETHLIPLLLENLLRPESELKVFGTDYPTRDGTCVRDYIHVTDLAEAHYLGLTRILNDQVKGNEIYNLGTEEGSTVLEVIQAAERVTGRKAKILHSDRRPGDAAVLVASAEKARKVLGWKCRHSEIEMILKTAFQWQAHLHELRSKPRR